MADLAALVLSVLLRCSYLLRGRVRLAGDLLGM